MKNGTSPGRRAEFVSGREKRGGRKGDTVIKGKKEGEKGRKERL
jgi:hypothetical protein